MDIGNYGGDHGYQNTNFLGISRLKKAGNIGNQVNGASQIYKYSI